MHSTNDVQWDRYKADKDLAASGSVPSGRNSSIEGRGRGSERSIGSSSSEEKANSI